MLIESLKVFCDLIDTQSFSRAAVLNSVTQSAVSQQIKSIEKRHGKTLVERGKHRLSLTAEGEIFYRCSREIVQRYAEMQNRIQELDSVVSGPVRLSAIYCVGMLELGPYIRAYLKAYPGVDLHLEYERSGTIYDRVAGGETDVGIVAYPEPQSSIRVIPFVRDRLVVICSSDHPLAERGTISVKDLDGLPFIACVGEMPTRRALEKFLFKHRVQPDIVMELDNVATIINAVEIGLGLSIAPATLMEQGMVKAAVVALELAEGPLSRQLGILVRSGRSLPVAVRKLVESLTEGKKVETGIGGKRSGKAGVSGR